MGRAHGPSHVHLKESRGGLVRAVGVVEVAVGGLLLLLS